LGLLESAAEREVTSSVSWVPVIGGSIPDQSQAMRIHLKVAVIDVRSGQWSMFSPDAFVDTALSAERNRAARDQRHVELLKAQACKAASAPSSRDVRASAQTHNDLLPLRPEGAQGVTLKLRAASAPPAHRG
jgi:hypothetical protein